MLSTRTSTSVVPSPATIRQALTPSSNPPSTPQASATTNIPPSPGTFQHPRLREIVNRQSRNSFTSRNVQTIVVNSALLFGSYITGDAIIDLYGHHPAVLCSPSLTAFSTKHLTNFTAITTFSDAVQPTLTVIRALLLLNILLSLRPVIPYNPHATGIAYFLSLLSTGTDQVTDIPLTPTQRALLGLPPSAKNTPDSTPGVITPPRYRRTSGSPQPNSDGRHSTSVNFGSSPLSTSRIGAGAGTSPLSFGTPLSERKAGASPAQSPLFHKVVTRNESFGESTASGAGFDTSLRRSQSMRERSQRSSMFVPDTPSPVAREREKRAIPGVNYKWLYEKAM